jgi:hypothetical protein
MPMGPNTRIQKVRRAHGPSNVETLRARPRWEEERPMLVLHLEGEHRGIPDPGRRTEWPSWKPGNPIGRDREMPRLWLRGRRHNDEERDGVVRNSFLSPTIFAEHENHDGFVQRRRFFIQEIRKNPRNLPNGSASSSSRPLEEDQDANLRTRSDAGSRRLFGF